MLRLACPARPEAAASMNVGRYVRGENGALPQTKEAQGLVGRWVLRRRRGGWCGAPPPGEGDRAPASGEDLAAGAWRCFTSLGERPRTRRGCTWTVMMDLLIGIDRLSARMVSISWAWITTELRRQLISSPLCSSRCYQNRQIDRENSAGNEP